MKKIKNWEKFNEKPFRIVEDEIKKGDYFIFNDDGRIRKCTNIDPCPAGSSSASRINYTMFSSACKKIVFDDSVKMNFDSEKLPEIKTTPPNLKKGDKIYFLYDYDLMSGTIESIGPKNVKIYFNTPPFKQMHISKPFDKVAEPDENICIVWEQWKGSRGGYRIERQLYQNKLKPAKNWPYQALVWEDSYGKESES